MRIYHLTYLLRISHTRIKTVGIQEELKMLEKDIEKVLVAKVRKLGGRAYKWVSPGNDGVPDRIVILPDMRPVFVELKAESGKLSALQKVQIRRLLDMGQDVRVLRGIREVEQFLEDCDCGMKLRQFEKEVQSDGK